jgi:hypothetical protein
VKDVLLIAFQEENVSFAGLKCLQVNSIKNHGGEKSYP